MPLHRSEKARLELRSKQRVLGLRARGALFMADGQKVQTQLQDLLQDDGSILQGLISEGYLIRLSENDAGASSFGAAMPAQTLQLISISVKPQAVLQSQNSVGDTFQGKRSLATTRMFLFDICERMFSRQAPQLGLHYRNHLREARDRESMLLMVFDILEDIEKIAGAERAEGIRERIALLMPEQ